MNHRQPEDSTPTRREPLDHGMLNLPVGHKGRGKSIDRQIDEAKAAERKIARERARQDTERRRAARDAERARPKLTREDCLDATAVRTDLYGWESVVRVNKTSVSVKRIPRVNVVWVERIPFSQVLEVRR